MKLVKMSLAAAVLLGASAFAIDNVKVSGDAKLFYGTEDSNNNALFDKTSSMADTAVRLGATADLTKGVSAGATLYAVSTLGLENNLVEAVWSSAHTVGADVEDQWWMGEAWMAATLGKTTLKIGRMELDTPLAFSEKWNIAPNTFEAAVAINQDIPSTTLVGAWVGKSNSSGTAGVVAAQGMFTTFSVAGSNAGAYAAGVVNNSYKPLTAQAWYYDVVDIATAYWLQADVDCQLVKGLKLGAQYTDSDASSKGALAGANMAAAYAVKVGYAGVPGLNVSAAYSQVDEGTAIAANTAGTQSKLYTEAWWNYGYVGQGDTKSFNVTAEYDAGIAKVGAYYTNVDASTVSGNNDMQEVALTASKSFGPLDATLAYINAEADNYNAADSYNIVQAYLTLNF